MKRHEPTDEQWDLVSPLIPRSKAKTGRKRKDPRVILNGIFWTLVTGAPWRDLPECFGSCKTVHRCFSQWRQNARRRHKPRKLAGDKGYSAQSLRDRLKQRLIEPVIPHKDHEHTRHAPQATFDKAAYCARCVVEHCVGWLKENRRIGTRFEKLAVNFLGMLQLAIIKRYLRLLF